MGMKELTLLIVVLLVGACTTAPRAESVAGEYEFKEDGDTWRLILLDNGITKSYKNGEKGGWSKWEIVDGVIHVEEGNAGIKGIFRINKDGSLTEIAGIDKDEKQYDLPSGEQKTLIKSKDNKILFKDYVHHLLGVLAVVGFLFLAKRFIFDDLTVKVVGEYTKSHGDRSLAEVEPSLVKVLAVLDNGVMELHYDAEKAQWESLPSGNSRQYTWEIVDGEFHQMYTNEEALAEVRRGIRRHVDTYVYRIDKKRFLQAGLHHGWTKTWHEYGQSSITYIARIDRDGNRTDVSTEAQETWIKINQKIIMR